MIRFPAVLLILLFFCSRAGGRPEIFYNVYRHTPRVEIVTGHVEQLSPEESDRQHALITDFSTNYSVYGSSFFKKKSSVISNVKPAGLIARVFPKMPSVLRIWASFKKRAQNYLEIRFKKPVPIPRWTESLEFWSLEYGAKRGYRLVYTDSGGREHFLNFKMKRIRGWVRYAANIPVRRAKNRPFSYRYQQLHLTRFILLDDFAGKRRNSIYHLAALSASRKVITGKNRRELWQFSRVMNFNADSVRRLKIRQEGVSNFSAGPSRITNTAGSFLRVQGTMQEHGITRIRLRFQKPLRIRVCRKLLIQIRAKTLFDRVLLLVATDRKKYYLIDFGTIHFSIWRKLEISIPPWIVQNTGQTTRLKGLLLHEVLILPVKKRWKRRISLDIAWIGAVYDRDIHFISKQRQFRVW